VSVLSLFPAGRRGQPPADNPERRRASLCWTGHLAPPKRNTFSPQTGSTPQNLLNGTQHPLTHGISSAVQFSPTQCAFCTPPDVYNRINASVEFKGVRSLGKDRTIREPPQRCRSTLRCIKTPFQPMMYVMVDWRKARGGMRSREGSSRTTVFKMPIPFISILISPCLSTTNSAGSGRLFPAWLVFDPLFCTLQFAYPFRISHNHMPLSTSFLAFASQACLGNDHVWHY
jgi:hypothetical protein